MILKMLKLILLVCFYLTCIAVHGFGESEESALILELIDRSDSRIADNEIEKSDEEKFRRLILLDIERREAISCRLGGGQSCGRKDNNGEDIGQYFVRVLLGTPGQEFFLRVDMASNLTWFNCIYDSALPEASIGGRKNVFEAHKSKTFQKLPCSSKLSNIDSPRFPLTSQSGSNPCGYENASHAKGIFGTDTLSFSLTIGRTEKTEKIDNVVIGCTTGGGTLTKDATLGLGIGHGTFVDVIASRCGGRFSFYLANHPGNNCSSYLALGDIHKYKPEIQGRIQHTKLLRVPPYYAVHLVKISIGENLSLPLDAFDLTVNGTVVLDSGSTWSTLPSPVYEQVMNELRKFFGGKYNETGPIPPFEYCFNATGFDVNLSPHIVLYLKGGIRFEPPLQDYVVVVKPQVKCIGLFRATADQAGVIVKGRMMLGNHLWVVDLVNKTLGFVRSTCL